MRLNWYLHHFSNARKLLSYSHVISQWNSWRNQSLFPSVFRGEKSLLRETLLKTGVWKPLTQISLHRKPSCVRAVLLDGYSEQKPRSHTTTTSLLQTLKWCKVQPGFIPLKGRPLNKETVPVIQMPMVSLRRKWRGTKGNWTTSDVNYVEKLVSCKVPFGILLKRVPDALHRLS